MRKKLTALVVFAVMVFCLLPATALAAVGDSDSDGTYAFKILTDSTCEIVSYSGTETGTLTIPGSLTSTTYGTFSVTGIGSGAFQSKSIAGVVVPEGVTYIGYAGFYGCANLTSVMLPSTLTSIGNYCFELCTALQNIALPEKLTSITDSAFYGDTKLDTITMGNKVTSIGDAAFNGCSKLTGIRLSNTLQTIGNSAFQGTALTSIDIPASVQTIKSQAFVSLPLTSVTLNEGLVTIGPVAFEYANINEITIPGTVTSIGDAAFALCSKLTKASILNKETAFGSGAFGSNKCSIYGFAGSTAYIYATTSNESGFTDKQFPFNTLYTVTFNSEGGSGVSSQIITSGDKVTKPTAPTWDGHLFEGWYTDSGLTAKYDFSTAVTSDITLHAKWTVTITATSGNTAFGSVSGEGDYTPGTIATLTATPNTGYYFTGWYNGDTLISADAIYKFTVTKAITLTGRFATKVTVTAASVSASYGTVSGGGNYTPGTSVTLTATANTGYYFAGWYNGTTMVSANASYTFSASTDVSIVAQFDKIGIPETITATASAHNKITVSWSAVTGAKGYYVYRSTSADGKYKRIGTSKKTTYVNSGVTTGTKYYYKVAAYTKSYTGKFYSAVASAASALGQVTKVTAKSSNPKKAIIKWKAVPGAKKYQVLRSDTMDGTYTAVKTTSAKTITNTGLIPGNTYYYKVVALSGAAYGPDSDIASVTVKAAK